MTSFMLIRDQYMYVYKSSVACLDKPIYFNNIYEYLSQTKVLENTVAPLENYEI